MPKDITSPFKDYVQPKAGFEVKETLGDKPGVPGKVTDVSGIVSPKELPTTEGSLWHGPGASKQ